MGVKPLLLGVFASSILPVGAAVGGELPVVESLPLPARLAAKAAITEDNESGFDNRPREIFHEICRMDLQPHHPLTESAGECRDWATYISRVSLNDVNVEYDFKAVNAQDTPTRQSARRFYEWNPPQGPATGALIAAHIHQDIDTFKHATPTHQKAFRPPCAGTEQACTHTPMVYLANEESWVDTFGASYGANTPFNGNRTPGDLLLTNGQRLSQETKDALARIEQRAGKKGRVHLVGGTKALAPLVEEELKAMGWHVTRSAGLTRVETVANMRPTSSLPIAGSKHFTTLVRGFAKPGEAESAAYADAVNARFDYSMVYVTNSDHLPEIIKADMTQASVQRLLFGWATSHGLRVYGGSQAISDQVVADFANIPTTGANGRVLKLEGVNRIAGATRYHTAAEAARQLMPEDPKWAKAIVLVDGAGEDLFKTAFPARGLTNVVYTQGDTIPGPTADLLREFDRPDRDLAPAPEHRMVFCYASAKACESARQILYTNP